MLHVMLHAHLQHHNDTIIKTQWQRQTQEDFFIKIYLTLLQGFERSSSKFASERVLETEQNWNILTPKLWPSALCLSRSRGLLNRSPGVHSAGCWLSLLHLISKFYGPQTPSAGCGFPYHISSNSVSNSTVWLLSWLSYIIVHAHLIAHAIFEIVCFIVIKRK